MNGFIVKVTAYHGKPVTIGEFLVRASVSKDTPLVDSDVVNDFERRDAIVDLTRGVNNSVYDVDNLIEEFETKWKCSVNYNTDIKITNDGINVHEFDIFAPSWSEAQSAQSVVHELSNRLCDWCKGFPGGR